MQRIILLAALACAVPCPLRAQCDWLGSLIQSFFQPRLADEDTERSLVGSLSKQSPQVFAQLMREVEQNSLSKYRFIEIPGAEERFRDTLARLYDSGEKLYGFRLEPRLRISDDNDLNAFATGSTVTLHAGLILYFLNPKEFWRSAGVPENQISSLLAYTNWNDDWDSVDAILAHEAAHNLMRHLDEDILATQRRIADEHWTSLQTERKDLANGKSGGAKRYIGSALKNFFQRSQLMDESRKKESEADTVSLILLQSAGYDPVSAYLAGQRLDLLTQLGENQPAGWQAGLNTAFCSDHPDWVRRLQEEDQNLNCLRATGRLCQEHMPFPVNENLSILQKYATEAERYRQETVEYASGNRKEAGRQLASKIEVKPEDSELYVDGQKSTPGDVLLSLGVHLVRLQREGYQAEERPIVVFPDIQPQLKIKLKRLRH